MGDSHQQWSCVECVIKKQEYEANLNKLEQRFLLYKQKLIHTDELIIQYKTKCKENECLIKRFKTCNALLKQYQSELANSLTKQAPLEKELEELKKAKASLEVKLEAESNNLAATEKHNLQLNNLVQQFQDDVIKYETKIELEKEAAANLAHSLKEAKAGKLRVEKRRLKTVQNIVSFANSVQKEGKVSPAQKRMMIRWRTELGSLENGEGDFSEDEGIFSPEVASCCSSRDTGLGSIAELSDDDRNSVMSVSLESTTGSIKYQNDMACKPLTLDNTKKASHRKNRKLSSGAAVPLNLGSNNEVRIGSNGVQIHDPSEEAPIPETKPAIRNLTSPSKISVVEVTVEDRSKVDHLEFGNRNMMVGPVVGTDPTTRIENAGLPSLFDPDISFNPSKAEFKEEANTSESVTICEDGGLDNSDSKLSLTREESPIFASIEKIMEEMIVPNLLSPMSPESETLRSHGQSSSSFARIEKIEMCDASTLTRVEMFDVAVGVEKDVEPMCHVASQTNAISNHSIASQTTITTHNTCAVQTVESVILHTAATTHNTCAVQTDDTSILLTAATTHNTCAVQTDDTSILNTAATIRNTCAIETDDIALLITADNISHMEDKLSNHRLRKAKASCITGKKVENKLSKKADVETESSTQSGAEDGILRNNNLKSYGALLKGMEKAKFLSLTSKQLNSVENTSKKQSRMVRHDYKEPERCLKEEVKKWESLAEWLCSNESNDSSSDEDFIPESEYSASSISTPQYYLRSCNDRSPTLQTTTSASGLFAVEYAPHSSDAPREDHPHEPLMPAAPHFYHHYMHMDPLLFQQNYELAMRTEFSKGCCSKNACKYMNHPWVPQASHAHQRPRNYCCCTSSCVNQNNHRPPESEASARSTSDKKCAKQVRRRIVDIEDSSADSEAGGDHKMPSRKMCLKNLRVDPTSTEIDSEIEYTSSRRRKICAKQLIDKQDGSVNARSGKEMVTKRMRKRDDDRDSLSSTDEEREKKTARLEKINTCLKRNYFHAKRNSNNKQDGNICTRPRKVDNKHNKVHKKGRKNYISKKILCQKSPLSKQKLKSKLKLKLLRQKQLNDTEESDTLAVEIHKKVDVIQHESLEYRQDCNVGEYCNTEKDVDNHSSYTELFGAISDVCSDEEQQSDNTAVETQVIESRKASDSSSNKRKRKTTDSSSGEVENRNVDHEAHMTQKFKRAKENVVSKESGGTGISLLSREQSSSNQEFKFSATNEKCSVPNLKGNAHETGWTASKTSTSRGTGSLKKLSKLETLRRSLIRAKQPTKIATEVPAKFLRKSKAFFPGSETNAAGSKPKKSVVRSLSEMARKNNSPNSANSYSNLSSIQSHHSTLMVPEESKMPSTNADSTAPNMVNGSVNINNSNNLMVEPPLNYNAGTAQIFANALAVNEAVARREINSETNLAVEPQKGSVTDSLKNFASADIVPVAEIPVCSQDRDLVISHTEETVSHMSEIVCAPDNIPVIVKVPALPVCYKENVPERSKILKAKDLVSSHKYHASAMDIKDEINYAPEIHVNSSLPDEVPATVEVPALPISYKESVPERSNIFEIKRLVTSPYKYHGVDHMSETVTKVGSLITSGTPNEVVLDACQAVTDIRDVISPATIQKVQDTFPILYQEFIPCPVSPIKDHKTDKHDLNSGIVEMSVRTLGVMQTSELPMDGSCIESAVRGTKSSVHQKSGKQIAGRKSTMTLSTERTLFTGCVLRWVLKDYEIEYKKKHPKKSKSMTAQLEKEESKMLDEMKRQEKAVFKKELQKLLSSDFSSVEFQQVLQKFGHLNSETASMVLAKIIVKLVSDDTKAQLDHSKKPAPSLTPTQQRLITLIFALLSQHQQYKDLLKTVLLGIEYRLFRLCHVPDIIRASSLARFYAALCRIQRDKQRIQAFCYDAMYCLYYKAFPLLFAVFSTYPEALPHAQVGKDNLLIMTMSSLILMQSNDKSLSEYKIDALKNILQTRYGYSQGVLTIEQLLQKLVNRLRTSAHHEEGLEASLILLAKRMGWDTSYRKLLCRNLIPLIDEWRAGNVSDVAIREVIIVMGYITRCFPVVEAKPCVQAVLNLLGNILLEQNVSLEVQEAAASSLVRLSRHNFFHISSMLVKWQPCSDGISDSFLEELLLFFEFRNPKWWHTFLKRKQVKHI